MTGAALGFSVMNALIRFVSEDMHPLQTAFLRNVFALVVMLPWMAATGLAPLRSGKARLYAVRAGMGYLAMACWFTALAFLPLAAAVSLTFTVPLFVTAGAALILGEIVGLRRWTATVVGFLGVLIIVRPGAAAVSWISLLPVLAAVFMAVSSLLVKTLSRTEDTRTIVLYLNVFLVPMSLVPALFVWEWPGIATLGVAALIGAVSVLAQLLLTSGFARTDASIASPFLYMQLPFVALIGFWAFGELPDRWTVLGAAVIAASAVYIAHREARLAAAEAPAGNGRDDVHEKPP
ncbi:MAG: DMT family transporter [Opitutales bacterium]|nr:DMT family transporter [Opitutales bacterium]